MANVFISYARRDRDRVLGLASALEGEGLSVWWDPNLVPGKRFRDIIARELEAADSVVVVWTAASIQSDYVQDEAEEARVRGVLVPITLEEVKPPAGFRQVQAADLSQWTGGAQHPEFRMLLTAVRTLVEVAQADRPAQPAAAAPVAPPDKRGAEPATAASAGSTSSRSRPADSPSPASVAPRPAAPTGYARDREPHFLPRLFDIFARPGVWVTAAILVGLSGARVGFGLAGTAAAMVVWAGAMAQAGRGAGFGPNRKMMVVLISLGVASIVGASMHSESGGIVAILVGGAVFAGVATIAIAAGGGGRRLMRDPAAHAAYREFRDEIKRDVLEGMRSNRRRRSRGQSRSRSESNAAPDG